MQNAALDEVQAGIKIAGRNINNLTYTDDTTLLAEGKEELKSLLMKVKEENENFCLKLNMEQQTGSKLRKEYVKAVYCHPAYLTSMQSTSCEMPGWVKHKLESIQPGEISVTSHTQMTPPLW